MRIVVPVSVIKVANISKQCVLCAVILCCFTEMCLHCIHEVLLFELVNCGCTVCFFSQSCLTRGKNTLFFTFYSKMLCKSGKGACNKLSRAVSPGSSFRLRGIFIVSPKQWNSWQCCSVTLSLCFYSGPIVPVDTTRAILTACVEQNNHCTPTVLQCGASAYSLSHAHTHRHTHLTFFSVQ